MTDGGWRVLGRGSFGVLCCGAGPGTKGTSSGNGNSHGRSIYTWPNGERIVRLGCRDRGVEAAGRGRARAGVRARRVRPGKACERALLQRALSVWVRV